MQITAIILAAVASVPLVAGQNAIVRNNCKNPAYVQSVPYDGSAPGPEVTINPGGSFSEAYRASGSTIKMGTLPALRAPLNFGYSRSDNPSQVYYELNNEFGNPFAGDRNTMIASRVGCPIVDCVPNDSACYSGPSGSKVNACNRPANVTVTLCNAN